jgi:hypothetical protein
MGRSLKSLFNGTNDKVYGPNDIVADEMFNNSAVYMGGVWKAMRHEPPMGGPDILQKLISAYGAYSKDVGVVIPLGQTYYFALQSCCPPLDQSKVTITSEDITPAHFKKPPDVTPPNVGN